MAVEHRETESIRRQGKSSNQRHRFRARQNGPRRLVTRFNQHRQAKCRHKAALRYGPASARFPRYVGAEPIHERVAQHVKRVGEQCGGTGDDACTASITNIVAFTMSTVCSPRR